jgi:hypothetical protein
VTDPSGDVASHEERSAGEAGSIDACIVRVANAGLLRQSLVDGTIDATTFGSGSRSPREERTPAATSVNPELRFV